MLQLVFINNGKTVTDSLTVAEAFGKEHKHVMRDIRSLECSEEFSQSNFGLSSYKDSTNRTLSKYIITENGFTMLAMGYTGKEAMRFKEMYINEFNRMRDQLNNNSLMGASRELQAIFLLDQRFQDHGTRIEHLENRTTIEFSQQKQLQKAGRSRVTGILGGKKTTAYQDRSLRSRVYSALWNDYQDYFEINSYCNTYKKDFDTGLAYVPKWTPPTNLMREIEAANGQTLF